MEYSLSARGIDPVAKDRYDTADRRAKELCGDLLHLKACNMLTEKAVFDLVQEIVLSKYYLTHNDTISDHFNALGEISIAKTLGKAVEDIRGIDLEAKCNGTSSVMTKKILLVIFIQRELSISIESELVPDLETISELASLVHSKMLD